MQGVEEYVWGQFVSPPQRLYRQISMIDDGMVQSFFIVFLQKQNDNLINFITFVPLIHRDNSTNVLLNNL